MSDTLKLKTCAVLPGNAVLGILTRALLFKTAGMGAVGPYFIMLFKGPIRLQLLNGKACKSYISKKAQEHSYCELLRGTGWREKERKWNRQARVGEERERERKGRKG